MIFMPCARQRLKNSGANFRTKLLGTLEEQDNLGSALVLLLRKSRQQLSSLTQGQDHLNPPSRRQNGKDIEGKWPPQAVILPARAFCFEIKAILASEGFDPYCPLPRWQS
jgi:hypothetical protein